MKTNNTIIRVPLSKGDYATLSNRILHHDKISSNAKVLLQILLNNTPEWEINLDYYSKRFGWGKEKQASIIKELKENGFININKYSLGQGKGFKYLYMISEYGDIASTEDLEPNINEAVIDNAQDEIDEKESILITNILTSTFSDWDLNDNYINNVWERLMDAIKKGAIKKSNFNSEKYRVGIWKNASKQKLKEVDSYIETNLLIGTIAQRKVIKAKVMEWCKSQLDNGVKVNTPMIRHRLLVTQTSVIGANRILPDYMD